MRWLPQGLPALASPSWGRALPHTTTRCAEPPAPRPQERLELTLREFDEVQQDVQELEGLVVDEVGLGA